MPESRDKAFSVTEFHDAMRGMERLDGLLRIGEGLVADVELVAGKSKHSRTVRSPCSLELADGSRVAVNASQARLRGFKGEMAADGQWDEVEGHPAAAPFTDVAPGPHVRVKLMARGPGDGSRVVVEGEVSRGSPGNAPEDYRANAPLIPVHIDAASIRALGQAAERKVEEKKKAPMRSKPGRPAMRAWTKGWLIMAAIGSGIAVAMMVQAMLMPSSASARLPVWSMAFAAILLTASAALNLRPVTFVSDQQVADPRGAILVVWATVGVLPLGVLLTSFSESIPLLASGDIAALSFNKRGQPVGLRVDMLRWYAVAFQAGVAALAIGQWLAAFSAIKRARVLSKALSPAPEYAIGKWIVAEGLVESGTNLVREFTLKVLGKYAGSTATSTGAPFTLKTARGELEVGPGGIWGTAEAGDASRTTTYVVRSGDHAVVAGRLSEGRAGLSLAGKGEESLFLYATSAAAPRRDLLKRVWLHRAQLLVVAIAMGGALLLAVSGR